MRFKYWLAGILIMCMPVFGQAAKNLRAIHAKQSPAVQVDAEAPSTNLKKIYSNLGPKTNAYLATDGWSLTGFNSFGGSSSAFSIALPFTPKSNSHVSQVRAAIQYNGSGANQVNISIYSDNGGAPGTLLAGPVTVTNLPSFPSCCTLAVANFSPLAVTAGTRYWVVGGAPTSGQGSDFVGVWNWDYKVFLFGGTNGVNGWFGENGDTLPAGAVMGSIP